MWYLSLLGRREHYALLSFLHEHGKLGLLATDVWCGLAGREPCGWLPRKLALRHNPKLRIAPIVSQGILTGVLNSLSKQSPGQWEARPVWKPMHLQPVFAGAEMHGGKVSERLFDQGLCLPSGAGLSEPERSRVIAALKGIVS